MRSCAFLNVYTLLVIFRLIVLHKRVNNRETQQLECSLFKSILHIARYIEEKIRVHDLKLFADSLLSCSYAESTISFLNKVQMSRSNTQYFLYEIVCNKQTIKFKVSDKDMSVDAVYTNCIS